MKKKFLALALCGVLTMSVLSGCGNTVTPETESKFEILDTDLKVGMITNSGSIDDRSFNQGTWEGITGTVKNNKYLRPTGTTETNYLTEIKNLYDAGYKFIIAPGYKLETAIFVAQDKYPDAKFVLLDGAPQNGDGNPVVKDNTVSVFFAEHEASFLAGVAAAVQIKEGDFGFIGGMKIPAVQRFEAGFEQGVSYANTNLGTHITLKPENMVYQGTFDDKAAGQQLAASMYDRGVKVIFTAASAVGLGSITEAKERASKGEEAWIIGVDVNQYEDGIYNTDTNASVVLTSAIKFIDQATHDLIKAEVEGNFPGGQTLVFDVKNNGVGIPSTNPNLSEETMSTVNSMSEKIKTGDIVVEETLLAE